MSCISLKLLVFTMLLNLLFMPISLVISVMFGYIALISSILVPIELMRNNGGSINKKQFELILLFLCIICVNSISSLFVIKTEELENMVKALISFFMMLLAISVNGIKYTEKDLKFFFYAVRFFAIVMIIYAVIPFNFQYTIVNEYGKTQFTLSMGNPNATAAKILFAIIVLCIENAILKSRFIRNCNVFLIFGLLYVILKLRSRTAFVCALIFIVYSMFFRFRVKRWMTFCVWLVPLVFIPIQLILIKFPVLELFGKSMATGRDTMFSDFLVVLSSDPYQLILGDFADHQLANYHNIIFTMLFNFGLVGLILLIAFWRIESNTSNKIMTRISQYAWMGWIVFVVHSMAEAAVLSGAFTFGSILILLNRMTKDRILILEDSETIYDWTLMI